MAGFLADCLAGFLAGFLADLLAGWLVDFVAGLLADIVADFVAGFLAGCLADVVGSVTERAFITKCSTFWAHYLGTTGGVRAKDERQIAARRAPGVRSCAGDDVSATVRGLIWDVISSGGSG